MKINGVNFTLGADPEVFVTNGLGFMSAHGLVPGSKEDPYPVEGGAVQVDGMALEFNIDPAEDYDTFQHNIDVVKAQLKDMIGDLSFSEEASMTFTEDFLEGVPPENRELGCSPDYNGWTMEVNEKPDKKLLMRTVGGHVHAGGFVDGLITEDTINLSGRLARIMDETLGVYSILWDHDDLRREMYGAGGCFRPKSYGMEYRSLSNKWIFNSSLTRFVHDMTYEAIEKLFDLNYEPDPIVREIMDGSLREHSFFKGNPKAQLISHIMET